MQMVTLLERSAPASRAQSAELRTTPRAVDLKLSAWVPDTLRFLGPPKRGHGPGRAAQKPYLMKTRSESTSARSAECVWNTWQMSVITWAT